ncbi:hypothetical protein BDW59DRAFT_159291 [Aspergillus cavernicola]|uniref:DUF924-domain-containing protein n=1 Tax=Aspergillus cavernicola TaxID=176166 RepID=A0ABR4IM93_9EURO
MSGEPKVDLSKFLGPSLPSRVNTVWFQHVQNDQNFTLPSSEVFMRWFSKDATFDLECAMQFKPILEAIHQLHLELQTQAQVQAQAEQILNLVKPKAALVFTFFDPIARILALRALDDKVASSSPKIRYRLALRLWFYLPFMHSEDLSHQELVLEKYHEMDEDIRRLLDETPAEVLSENELAYREILAGNRKAVEGISAQNLKFQKEHHDIIERFGRYPHRNNALGRASTPEEEKFFREENISFG